MLVRPQIQNNRYPFHHISPSQVKVQPTMEIPNNGPKAGNSRGEKKEWVSWIEVPTDTSTLVIAPVQKRKKLHQKAPMNPRE